MRSAIIAVSACAALTIGTNAFADDVNRTGQPQTDESNKSGTAPRGGDANTMGGATTERTEPGQMPQREPPNGTHPDTKPKTNAEPDTPASGNR
jgi:hypothetical protein